MTNKKYVPNLIILSLGLVLLSFIILNNKVDVDSAVQKSIQKNDSTQAKHFTRVADSYLKGLNEKDLKGILSLFADTATIEDPVGSKIIYGRDAIRKFYSSAVRYDLTLNRTGSVRVAGREAAFPFDLTMKVNGKMMTTNIIDVFVFNETGKIVSMRAFWGPSNQKPVGD